MYRWNVLFRYSFNSTKKVMKFRPNVRCFCVARDSSAPNENASKMSSEQPSNSSSTVSDQKTSVISSYELLKLYIMDRKPVTNPLLLFHALMGASRTRKYNEFLQIFPSWWKMFSENLDHFDGDQLCEIINYLGHVNKFSKASLRRKFSLYDINFLVSKIIANGVDKLTPKSIACLYQGLQRLFILSDTQSSDGYPPKKLVTETITWLKSIRPDDVNFRNYAVSSAFIACSLANIGYALDKDSLIIFVQTSSAFFQHENTFKRVDTFADFETLLLTFEKFAHAFLVWQMDADEIAPGVWTTWFSGVQRIFNMFPRFEQLPTTEQQQSNEETTSEADKENPFVTLQKLKHAKDLGAKVAGLSTTAVDVATKFDKIDLLTNAEFKKLFKNLLEKHLPAADPRKVARFSGSLRVLETFLQSKSPFDLKSGSEFDLVSKELYEIIRRKVDEANEARESRRRQFGKRYQENIPSDNTNIDEQQQEEGFRPFQKFPSPSSEDVRQRMMNKKKLPPGAYLRNIPDRYGPEDLRGYRSRLSTPQDFSSQKYYDNREYFQHQRRPAYRNTTMDLRTRKESMERQQYGREERDDRYPQRHRDIRRPAADDAEDNELDREMKR